MKRGYSTLDSENGGHSTFDSEKGGTVPSTVKKGGTVNVVLLYCTWYIVHAHDVCDGRSTDHLTFVSRLLTPRARELFTSHQTQPSGNINILAQPDGYSS